MFAAGEKILAQKLTRVLAIMAGPAADVTFAHEGATGIVATRMDTMKGFAAEMKALSAMIRNKAVFDSAAAAAATQSISDHADQLRDIFLRDRTPIQAVRRPQSGANGMSLLASSNS